LPMRRLHVILVLIVILAIAATAGIGAGQKPPTFVLFLHGLWGSMDNLPSADPAWLQESPYPHYRKHQEAPFLNGPDYHPIPQSFLKLGNGPGLTRLIIHPYRMMQREFPAWAEKAGRAFGPGQVRVMDNWQALLPNGAPGVSPMRDIGRVNLIYFKYDWRLEFPRIAEHYFDPFIKLVNLRWPGAEISLIGHSLGGTLARYLASYYAGRLTSLISVGGPQYGIHEVGLERNGMDINYGNGGKNDDHMGQLGLQLTERFFFGTYIIKGGTNHAATVKEFTARYISSAKWMDPRETDSLADGYGTMPKLRDAVPHAIAVYGLGFGSFDPDGNYHEEIPDGPGVGPCLGPEGGPLAYAVTGDGRVDPISAVGPFPSALCIGKEVKHSDMMASPLVLTWLIDSFFYGGAMPETAMREALLEMGVKEEDLGTRMAWLGKAREIWRLGGDRPPARAPM